MEDIERKKYIAEIFLKKCTFIYQEMEGYVSYLSEIISNDKGVPDMAVELQKEIKIDEYINNIMPIILEAFSTKELQEFIEFYSSKTGSKIRDPKFLSRIGDESNKFVAKIERDIVDKIEEKRKP